MRERVDGLADVAIVGAGPAGAAAALRVLQVRPDARVLLLDAAAFPRDKTCGDGDRRARVRPARRARRARPDGSRPPAVPRLRLRTPGGRTVERACARPNRVIPRDGVRRRPRRRGRRPRCGAAPAPRAEAAGPPRPRRARRARSPRAPWSVPTARTPWCAASSARRRAPDAIDRRRHPRVHPGAAATRTRWRSSSPAGPYPAYAWSFPLADGRANVGYGVFDRRGSGQPAASSSTACTRLLPGPGARAGHRPRPPPAALHRPALPPRRPGAARRRRRRPGQPADRRGHLRRGRVGRAGRAGRRCTGAAAGARTGRRCAAASAATTATAPRWRGSCRTAGSSTPPSSAARRTGRVFDATSTWAWPRGPSRRAVLAAHRRRTT